AQQDTSGISSVFLWSGVLIGIIIIAFLAYAQFKRWMREPETSSSATGFTLSDLRELHRQGKMTDVEFEMAKVKILGTAKKAADAMPDPLAGRRNPPHADQPASQSPERNGT
ncbi:MAG TPA: hypothetical protein VLI90_00245, partial [Tepidisphaeraceae bacterium]|nr:hypothetical protein [Tepidisphaeraceae bacterium]